VLLVLISSSADPWPANAPDQPPQRAARAAVGCIRKFDAREPGSQQRDEIFTVELSIPENCCQQTGTDGLTAADWHNGSSAIRVPEKVVAAFDPGNLESGLPQGGDHFPSGDPRKARQVTLR
jgi:hypothetical protein